MTAIKSYEDLKIGDHVLVHGQGLAGEEWWDAWVYQLPQKKTPDDQKQAEFRWDTCVGFCMTQNSHNNYLCWQTTLVVAT